MLNSAHLAGSVVNSALAVAASVMIYRVMHEGLTAESNRAGIVMLATFAVGRTWHSIGETLGIPTTESFEYLMYAVGYVYFMTHVLRRRPVVRQSASDALHRKK